MRILSKSHVLHVTDISSGSTLACVMLAHEKGRDLFGRLRHGLGKQAFAIVVSWSGRRLVGLWRLSFFSFLLPFFILFSRHDGNEKETRNASKMHLNERHCAPCLCSCGVAIYQRGIGGRHGRRAPSSSVRPRGASVHHRVNCKTLTLTRLSR